ncbi:MULTISPECIES: apiosidase-like domain-containing protein [Streptococcus]|uniref:DUF4038 domain-containing protein n=1 Tax=Streptococcus caledonicus TaxID=2614158 RepID=A0ABW0UBB7_9STRE|nr:DUF4038 domain-containing protein [Streptococcus sp. S784/96/1]
MFQVAKGQRYFTQDDKPVFYLADTCWSAFTNISESDWEYYLDFRKTQGFNTIQVNMLQQWDASQTTLDFKPFKIKPDGTFDFEIYDEVYFKRAFRMFEKAYQKNMTIALVLFWCNYLPNTWASQMPIKQLGIFPKDNVVSYVDKVMSLYDRFKPIYIISGDTDFQTDEVIEDYYLTALNRVKENNRDALTTLHIRGREADLPVVLKESPNLDFYMFQSGHNSNYREMSYQLAEIFSRFSPQKPTLNSEPCYEQMGYSRRIYGRFSREDVRKAAWQCVLSGASSGITYGAHGIWSWHNSHYSFDSSVGEAFESPYDWRDALHFPGAWDYAFLKKFWEEHGLNKARPAQYLLQNDTSEIRLAETETEILVYIPSNIEVRLDGSLESCQMTFLDLETKNQQIATACYVSELNQTLVRMHSFLRDVILIIKK